MKPLISVIVPVYKVEDYLDQCVSSIVNQTYSNLEVFLVVGDCGDNCPQMCRDWAKKDSRIKVVDRECNGLSDARNAGLDVMQGEYIAFIDSDDYIDKKYIELLYCAIEENGAKMSICGVHKVDEHNKVFESHMVTDGNRTEIFSGKEIFVRGTKGEWQYVTSWGKLFHKDIFKELRFPFKRLHEDEFTFPYVCYEQEKVACVPEMMYYYLQRSDSLMGVGYSEKDYKDCMDMWHDRIRHFEAPERCEMMSYILQSFLGWYMLYMSKNAKQMGKENRKNLNAHCRKYFLWLFKRPYLYDLSYNIKLAVKCVMTLINPDILGKRYAKGIK